MSTVRSAVKIEGKVYFELNEGEARVLEAIVGYGHDEFLKWFKKNLGSYYIEPHEKHIESLFDSLRINLARELSKIDEARSVLEGRCEAVNKRLIEKMKTINPQQS